MDEKPELNQISEEMYISQCGKGIGRDVFKIDERFVDEVNGFWDCPKGYCVKKAINKNGLTQNKNEVKLYNNILKFNQKQFLAPPFDWTDNFNLVLYPLMDTSSIERSTFKDFKEKLIEVNLVNIIKDINKDNVGKYKDTLYLIDFGGGKNTSISNIF